jgi:ribosomal protein S24E
MATEIKVWQIVKDELKPIETVLKEGERREEDLEKWIKQHPSILGEDILIIGEQVSTKSGRIDFLGIDKLGNLVVIELKRDKLTREVIAQALDYVSDLSSWEIEQIKEICREYRNQELEEYLTENFENINVEDLPINIAQRILLVGFSTEESLERIIEWLSEKYGVSINAVILKYIKTKNGEELIARTAIIPEEVEKERSQRRYKILVSDEPGNYESDELKEKLKKYLSKTRKTPRRIREILLPLCLKHDKVTREMLKEELINRKEAVDEGEAGIIITTISREIGLKRRDYLRQVIRYDKSPGSSEKENYRIEEKYKELVKNVLEELGKQKEKG